MTDTETKFRINIKKEYPEAYIKKLPDYKTGAKGKGGWPDYIIINNGCTIWYEVKSSFGDTITLNHFTDAQKIEFNKMIKAGAYIIIYAFSKTKGIVEFDYTEILSKGKISF